MNVWTIDAEALRHVCPNLGEDAAEEIARGLGEAFHRYEIDNPRRAAMAVAQWAEESDHFRTSEEYASGAAYEGRRDLGNVEPGDGCRFKGRGRIMITGRAHYVAMADVLALDCVDTPEILARSPHSELASGQWWHDHGCNDFCDRGDFEGLTRRINGGLNGYGERCRLHGLANQVADKLVPRDLWAVLTDEERHQMEILAAERRVAKRNGGWDKVDPLHLRNASAAKTWLRARAEQIATSATAEPNGWRRNDRHCRHDLITAAIAR